MLSALLKCGAELTVPARDYERGAGYRRPISSAVIGRVGTAVRRWSDALSGLHEDDEVARVVAGSTMTTMNGSSWCELDRCRR